MHDRRREIGARLTRALEERLRPAVHTTIAPLTVEVVVSIATSALTVTSC